MEQLFKALQFHERKGWEAAVRSGTEADERPDVLVLPVCSSPATRPSPVLYPPFARYPRLSSATIPWPCHYHSNVATACLLPTNPYPFDGRSLPLTLPTAAQPATTAPLARRRSSRTATPATAA